MLKLIPHTFPICLYENRLLLCPVQNFLTMKTKQLSDIHKAVFFSHFLLTFLYQQILLDGQLQVEGVSAATKRNQVTGSQELTKLAFRFKVVASAFLS